MPEKKDVDWQNMDLSTPEKLHDFALSVEAAGQEAVARAIADHKAAGNPIYFRDPAHPDILIKEMADGSRFSVKFDLDGIETVLAPLPAG